MSGPLEEDDPARLGPYRLLRRLGAGGNGVLYLAAGPDGGPVALKALRAAPDPARIAAARRVARFWTAPVLDHSEEFVVCVYVDGPTLQDRVRMFGPLHGGELDRLAVGTATALRAIHGAGLHHGAFDPLNVLLGPDGPRVVDFAFPRDGAPAEDVRSWARLVAFAAAPHPLPPGLHEITRRCLSPSPPDAATLLDWLVGAGAPAADSAPTPPSGTPTVGFIGRPEPDDEDW